VTRGTRCISLLVGLGALFLLVDANVAAREQRPVAIEIHAQPLRSFDLRDASRQQFGNLQFRGGMVLQSSFRHFGGLSAIRMGSDGENFIALTDKGWWLRARLHYEGKRPAAISDAEMAPILGPTGAPLAARGWYDTEAIADDGGTLYVAIERVHRIVRFDYAKDGLLARGQPIPVPPAMRSLPANKGIEALVFVPKGQALSGTLIAISERGLDASGNLLAFLIGGPTPGGFTVKRTDDFDVSDAALLRGGDLLLLERRFSWMSGLAIRMRRLKLGEIKPGVLVDGPVVLEADMRQEIDNFEGLSVHTGADGESVLTLVSDDNFSMLQRTLLLQFALPQEKLSSAARRAD
jgi:hypothetical protein